MVWQAESSFSFRLADAYVGSFPPALPAPVRRLMFGRPPTGDAQPVWRWLRLKRVGSLLLMRPTAATLRPIRRFLGTDPTMLPGVALFPVHPPRDPRPAREGLPVDAHQDKMS
jgi:hypothetical protein